VNLLKRVNHINLVRLLGYCLEEKQVLIYEYAEEGSIWDHLQGQNYHLLQRNGEAKTLLRSFTITVFEWDCICTRINLWVVQ
jgi:hypothetical protein